MNPQYTYLLIDAATIFFPLVFSFDKKVAFYKYWPALLPSIIITAAFFIVWDVLFSAQGVWWFSRDYTLPYRLLGLPVEEWLFFFTVPYACAFIAVCLEWYFPVRNSQDAGWASVVGIGIILILFALLNFSRIYTLSACAGCGIALLAAYFLRSKNVTFRADRFLLTYGVCLLPFLIVNGLLTALPVVLYNDAENTGVRIYTIPVEDVFYGMLLVLCNVWGMKKLKR